MIAQLHADCDFLLENYALRKTVPAKACSHVKKFVFWGLFVQNLLLWTCLRWGWFRICFSVQGSVSESSERLCRAVLTVGSA